MKRFRLDAPDGSIEWGGTNPLAARLNRELVIEALQGRWQVEPFHRLVKQLTGSEKGQCRQAPAQRNHRACCYLAWVWLRPPARARRQTLYQAQQQQCAPYWRQLNHLRPHMSCGYLTPAAAHASTQPL